ncbi:MAG: hypothetical protein RBR42_07205 [Desulfomicrobium sp.]|nr:hypothetical protein [Desulfomicrobium sp.]
MKNHKKESLPRCSVAGTKANKSFSAISPFRLPHANDGTEKTLYQQKKVPGWMGWPGIKKKVIRVQRQVHLALNYLDSQTICLAIFGGAVVAWRWLS